MYERKIHNIGHESGYSAGERFAEGLLADIQTEMNTIKRISDTDYTEAFANAVADVLLRVPCGESEVQQ